MKILITGTHFTTAVATIEELKKYHGVNIVYVGRKYTQEGDSAESVESAEIPKLGVKFVSITTGRLQKALTIYTIPSFFKIPVGFIQAFFILMKEKPDVVLSFGGYVAVPTVICAWLLSIPIIIHEQTLVSGLANAICSWFADKIAISFKEHKSFSGKKVILTGNPIRREIVQNVELIQARSKQDRFTRFFDYAKDRKLPAILVTGGNQGSHVINLAIEGCLDRLLNIVCIIHQTGESKFKDFEKLEPKQNERYIVMKWIGEEWATILNKVDMVVSRAGINTLTELAFLGKPTLVIPIPYLYKDEQNKNAKFFASLGLARVLPQDKLRSQTLLNEVKSFLDDLNHLKKQAKKAKEVIINDASKRLALEAVLLNSV